MAAAQAASFWKHLGGDGGCKETEESVLRDVKTQVTAREGPLIGGIKSGKFPLPSDPYFLLGNHGSVSASGQRCLLKEYSSNQKSKDCITMAGAP